ncbi:hypothetical protein J4443_00025 [Candidatus Woesearchaeota archaeon]|nr:hypothetical protein [Candidatus Woesearchaeota archaeon]
MKIINQITSSIVKHAEDGETIHSLTKKTGFAYSAVYKWIMILKDYDIIHLVEKGNKNIIKINKNNIYKKFIELDDAVSIVEKDRIFWDIIKEVRLRIRFIENTAVVIWTQGGYITGDFLDKIYFLEVYHKDLILFKKILGKRDIAYSENEIANNKPLVYITSSKRKFEVERKGGLPVISLKELVRWCKELQLDNILEQLDSMYNLKLNAKYSEIKTNIQ